MGSQATARQHLTHGQKVPRMRPSASRLVPDPVDRAGNRPDRLDALTRELRSAGSRGRTSAWLAERLGVSTRTVKRDVTALQHAGVPILASSGPQGGYVLDDSVPAASVSLTADEVLAIVVGLQATPDQPFAGFSNEAVGKLLRALPDELRATVAGGAGRIWIRPGESGHAADHEVRAVLTQAAHEHRVVLLDYEPADEPATPGRQVEPLGFAQARGRWFALAWCRDTDAGRWFGLDDITAAQATHETFEPRDVRDVFSVAPPQE